MFQSREKEATWIVLTRNVRAAEWRSRVAHQGNAAEWRSRVMQQKDDRLKIMYLNV